MADNNITAVVALGVARQAATRIEDGVTTDNIVEGVNNLYFSAGRARIAFSSGAGIVYDQGNGIFSAEYASTSTDGIITSTDKVKLNSISPSAEVNQLAFSTVNAGGINVSSDSKTGTFNLSSGSGISITGNNTTKTVSIGVSSIGWGSITSIPSPVITFTGDLSGSVTLSSLGSATGNIQVVDNSHNHTIANVTGLSLELANKADSGHTHTINDIGEASSAFSGSVIIGDKTLTINKGLIMSIV